MEVKELIEHIDKGERWFNNGKTRNRYIVGLGGMVLYKSKPDSNRTIGIWAFDFANWAKGVGKV